MLEALWREGGVLGGEQSGHVICLRDHVTGDGLAAALLLCAALRGRTLSEAAAVMPRFAQAKANVRVASQDLTPAVRDEVERVERRARERRPRARAAVGNGASRAGARGGRRPGSGRKSLW